MNQNKVLAGLIGSGIGGSQSPRIHEAEAKAHGLDLRYIIIDLAKPKHGADFLRPLLESAESMHFSGVNVTHPFKEAAFKLMHDLSKEAEDIGSVNTVVFRDGRWYGDNTDWSGFSENLKATMPDAPLNKVGLLGTGGAGLAIAYGLLKLGSRDLRLFDSNEDSAKRLQSSLRRQFPDRNVTVSESASAAVDGADGLVNATPMGMNGVPGMAIEAKYLRKELWVADIVYFPPETDLLKAAQQAGCRTCSGVGMAVRQAANSFREFFNQEPDVNRMLAELHKTHDQPTK